jgi:hypothetical protein
MVNGHMKNWRVGKRTLIQVLLWSGSWVTSFCFAFIQFTAGIKASGQSNSSTGYSVTGVGATPRVSEAPSPGAGATNDANTTAGSPGSSSSAKPNTKLWPLNQLVLEQVKSMPQGGGYSVTRSTEEHLRDAVSLDASGGGERLRIEAEKAKPSHCSSATYLVFLKTIRALQDDKSVIFGNGTVGSLLVHGQRDGEGVWGRWNANGPGTARLFTELKLGRNFTDFSEALPGDFMKIFWSDKVGKFEHGHSVVFLGLGKDAQGKETVRFWSSNQKAGYGEKEVPRSRVKYAVFSRLMTPQGLSDAAGLRVDPYLASLLQVESNHDEIRRKCGIQNVAAIVP